jgi:hypothetical protein
MFTGGCPIPHPDWEHGVAWADFPQLQPLLGIIWGLLLKGLIGEEILRTFLSHGVQWLHHQEAVVGMSPGPSCLVHPSFSRAGNVEANARVQETPALGDSVGQEARHACSERLWLQRLKSRVKGDLELMCS